MESFKVKLLVLFSIFSFETVMCQRGRIYPLTFQPEVDSLDIGLYFRNDRLVKLQLMCIFYDGPCDITGRWLKPRLIPGIFGHCPACTTHQRRMLPEWLGIFVDRYPTKFRAVIAQWLMDQGFKVPVEEIPKIQRAMGFSDPLKIIYPLNVINSTYDEALQTREFKRLPALISYFGRTRGGLVPRSTLKNRSW